MGALEKIKNVGSAVGNATGRAIEGTLQARETRARSPEFKAAMAKENAEFGSVLGKLGSNTLDTGVGLILKTPYKLLTNSLKLLYDKKYHGKDFAKDTLGLFLGRDGVAHNALKVTANAVHLTAKGTKIGLRQLFKL